VNEFDGDGRKTGTWEEDDPHGGMISGTYVEGQREGLWVHHFTDGAVRSECHYDHGELTGDCVWFRQTGGLLQKGSFLNGEKHGFWQRWSNTGALLDEGSFERGAKVGTWTQYAPDGAVRKTTTHR